MSQSKVAVDEMLISTVWFYTRLFYLYRNLPDYFFIAQIYLYFVRDTLQVSDWMGASGKSKTGVCPSPWRRSVGFVQICTEITLLIITLYNVPISVLPLPSKKLLFVIFELHKNDLEVKMK